MLDILENGTTLVPYDAMIENNQNRRSRLSIWNDGQSSPIGQSQIIILCIRTRTGVV